jgi:EAL domain-containing protein (putative c-di-GMP-specific phosphodiesterase class I)
MPSPEPLARGGPRAVLPQAQLREALGRGELRLHYQRIVSLETGTTKGVEALLRWQHPQGGLLPPDDFLPAVAHTPVIHEVTRWVLRTAVRELAHWPPEWTVSVNISALDATRQHLVRDVREALESAGADPRRLTLELTEQAMVQHLETAVGVLGAIRSLGVGLGLDDFGTGYSSLLYLRDLPITELKIDRTFLAGVPRSEEDTAIVTSVAQLGRSVGVQVIAEGVETTAQARVALQVGCHAAQGYLWGSPAEPSALDPDERVAVPRAGGMSLRRRPAPPVGVAQRVQAMLAEGASLHTIAAALNSEGLRTPKNVRWTARTVALVVRDLPPAEPR